MPKCVASGATASRKKFQSGMSTNVLGKGHGLETTKEQQYSISCANEQPSATASVGAIDSHSAGSTHRVVDTASAHGNHPHDRPSQTILSDNPTTRLYVDLTP